MIMIGNMRTADIHPSQAHLPLDKFVPEDSNDAIRNMKEDNDPMSGNQDSGYHSMSGYDLSNSNLSNGTGSTSTKPKSESNTQSYEAVSNNEQSFHKYCHPFPHYKKDTKCENNNYGYMVPFQPINNNINVQIQKSRTSNIVNNSLKSTENSKIKDNNDFDSENNEELEQKIEFCLKLGYSIEQIRSALQKMGLHAIKDVLLNHLVSTYNDNNVNGLIQEPLYPNLRARGPSTLDEGKIKHVDDSKDLRPIVIDGSNVAMSHGNKYFSCKGIQLAVDYFWDRNHRDITVFLPQYRKEQPRPDAPIKDHEILEKLEKERILVYTPSRSVNGKRVTCYDDRFILRLAQETDGIIVSNDYFRDLQNEKPEWKELINTRLVMYSFVSDRFMVPDDPLGRNGPSLDNMLRKRPVVEEKQKSVCPYGKKCTYGKKCKFFHPENCHSIYETLKENSKKPASEDAKKLAMEIKRELMSEVKALAMKDIEEENRKKSEAKSKSSSPPATARLDCYQESPQNQMNHITKKFQESMNVQSPQYYHPSQPRSNYNYSGRNPGREHQMSMMPPLHSDSVGRGTVRSTSPQHRHIPTNPNPYHSSPAALPPYGMPPQQSQKEILQPVQLPPHQYPHNPPNPSYSNPQPHQIVFDPNVQGHKQMMYAMQCGYPPHNMMILQQQDGNMIMQPSQVPHQQSQGYNHAYYQALNHSQEQQRQPMRISQNNSQGAPGVNYHAMAAGRQVYSSPNPHAQHQPMPMNVNQQHMATNQNHARMHNPQQTFKNKSDPRYHLHKNLCALFSTHAVEKVLTLYPDEMNPTKLAKLIIEFQ